MAINITSVGILDLFIIENQQVNCKGRVDRIVFLV